MIGEKPIVPKI
jgi:hypothetical protein